MKTILIIGAGSFLGGIGRYLLSQAVQGKFAAAFPYGTLTVNITGCFLIGILFALSERNAVGQEWRMFLGTGLLGGFTTFSSFSNETVALFRNGQIPAALGYIGASIFLGILATFLGIGLLRKI